jgi:hypothetical protein
VDFKKFFTELGWHRVSTVTVIHPVTNWRRLTQLASCLLPFFDNPTQVAHLVMTRTGSGVRPLGSLN